MVHVHTLLTSHPQSKHFLQRNLWSCPTQIKSTCYHAMIRPILTLSGSLTPEETLISMNKYRGNLPDSSVDSSFLSV